MVVHCDSKTREVGHSLGMAARCLDIEGMPPPSKRVELERLLSTGSRKVENFVRKRMFQSQDAEDVIQQTYLEAWRNRSRYASVSSPETWVCGIALNLVRKYFQNTMRPSASNIDDIASGDIDVFYLSSIDPDRRAECQQRLHLTLEKIQQLPGDMRATLEARLESDGSYQDTAQRLGVAVGTVRSRLSRARAQLREASQ
ncbi:RNA polymerase sigma factor [Salinicola avicenniae]|uniref:RNA polymerase sigma factor n=1 Tax=Salinicola avicenniae TaxID=2916836 RepID=UPI002072CF41|nr:MULTISPECIES: RNA polymerase sigma factor [unclassified Salinicola]